MPDAPGYIDLQVTSAYSFLRGASHTEELVNTAAMLGRRAMGLSDRNSLAGVVRAHVAARAAGIRLIVGVRLDLMDAPSLLVYPRDRAAYGRLCRMLTTGRRRARKGECHLTQMDLGDLGTNQVVIALPPPEKTQEEIQETFPDWLSSLKNKFRNFLYLAVSNRFDGEDNARLERVATWAGTADIPLVATHDLLMHHPDRRPLLDVMTGIRRHVTLDQAGLQLSPHAERHPKRAEVMARLFQAYPEALANTLEIAETCPFSLDELRYEYPEDPVPAGRTAQEELEHQTMLGAETRYPWGVPLKVMDQIKHELSLIHQLSFAPYFLTVHDIVQFARGRGILCQGRGSAANSAVCYCLGITAVDPDRIEGLFERFVSAERGEPPDIDVDFEHERREEVIQYIYEKYGRERAGLTAAVITYRGKSALREVGRVLGFSEDLIVAMQGAGWRRSLEDIEAGHLREAGLDPRDPGIRRWLALAAELTGFPRHLTQHTGGFVLTRGPLCEVVPIENAAMDDRTVIQWDKNDLDALGILKIDVLALGMLTCVRKALDLIARHEGKRLGLADIPPEDPATYEMLSRADSVGVFQVESRAQMSMLPRLKPKVFYDLVIEVAIVRPGPIQGDMVHPYLRRRQGKEVVTYPSKELEQVLGKTLGVPLFQEQAMRIAIVGAGFTPAEADGLRRAMATFRRFGQIHSYEQRFLEGMAAKGYEPEFAARCFKQIEGFADYGFPESHAASFALLVYVSAWLKCHHPAAFACALLNSQPMGFYAPAQIIRDARDHGVTVYPVDINYSDWDNSLESAPDGSPALRLGLRQVKGLAAIDGEALAAARGNGYGELADLNRRAGLKRGPLTALAEADAYGSLGLPRRQALWAVKGLDCDPLPLFAFADDRETPVILPEESLGEQVVADYKSLYLSLKAHPVGVLRDQFPIGVMPCAELERVPTDRPVTVAGLTIGRQRPGGANGVIFVTLEDETGVANLIVWPTVFERLRRPVLRAGLMIATGMVQREDRVIHVIVRDVQDATPLLLGLDRPESVPQSVEPRSLGLRSRDFH
ncbi:error-prone DNA polymerase [Magnetospira sp. QH-2]|uniref:error-prone DNA polymerase n=1 Tax=Magnetospira sp. (strain QH-2) TaxID=1288970 RepID=UPI0003E8148E|nr:error-prone DNA polymerase [Magnetospira sp. QH-2]CCQ74275.1 Error-prone DNA polymerase [Magnetospira sp. QH-2]